MIPEELIALIHEGVERECVEFKREINLSDRPKRAAIARSISAIANTCDDNGYYIVGVIDKKSRITESTPDEYIAGFDCPDLSDISLKIKRDCLDFFLNDIPQIHVTLDQYPGTSKKILLVVTTPPFLRPYSCNSSGGGEWH